MRNLFDGADAFWAYLNSNLNNNDVEIDIHFSPQTEIVFGLKSSVMGNEFPPRATLIKPDISYLNCIVNLIVLHYTRVAAHRPEARKM